MEGEAVSGWECGAVGEEAGLASCMLGVFFCFCLKDLEDFSCGRGAVAGIQREQWMRVGAALEYLL